MSECTANWLQVVISGLTFLLFMVLAIITYVYARHTKRMADVMNKEFGLRFQPFADVRVGLPWMVQDYSGFNIPLEVVLLREFPLSLTKIALEISLGEEEVLKPEVKMDRILTKKNPILKECIGAFSDEKIHKYIRARRDDASIKEPVINGLYIYHRTLEGKEELFQRLPVPYRNYYELDKICDVQG